MRKKQGIKAQFYGRATEEGARKKKKGGKILLKSNWRMNEKEQEKVDAELVTSGEEGSKKQQGKTGVV